MRRRIVYVPLDDRPPNLRDPAIIASIAGIELAMPPRPLLGRFMRPGDPTRIARWLELGAHRKPHRVVSLDMLCSGGLVASRNPRASTRSAREALGRVLGAPGLTRAFLVLLRPTITVACPADVPVWRALFDALSRSDEAPPRAPEGVPPPVYRAHLRARRRQMTIARDALSSLAHGHLEGLTLFQEDCRPGGVVRREHRQIEDWAAAQGLDPAVLGLQPGADEAGMLLVMRTALGDRPGPAIEVVWADPALASWIAPYEDRPLAETVEAKLATAGGRPVRRGGDFALYVHGEPGTARDSFLDASRPAALPARASLPAGLAHRLEAGQPVAVADVRFANSADPSLAAALLATGAAARLAAFAGWNTAANTIGSVVAHVIALWLSPRRRPIESGAHRHLMAHRFLEDYLYACHLRPWLRDRLGPDSPWVRGYGSTGRSGRAGRSVTRLARGSLEAGDWRPEVRPGDSGPPDSGLRAPDSDVLAPTVGRLLESRVGRSRPQIEQIYGCFGLDPASRPIVRLPWGRVFEAEVCPGGCPSPPLGGGRA